MKIAIYFGIIPWYMERPEENYKERMIHYGLVKLLVEEGIDSSSDDCISRAKEKLIEDFKTLWKERYNDELNYPHSYIVEEEVYIDLSLMDAQDLINFASSNVEEVEHITFSPAEVLVNGQWLVLDN